jgi:two-component system, OmpR family, phosphate regulon sensor histidine kinase PhoR
MRKFRSKMNFAFLLLIFIALLVVGLWIGHLFKVTYVEEFQKQMKSEANLIAAFIEEVKLNNRDIDTKIDELAQKLEGNITIVANNGDIIANTNGNFKYRFVPEEGFFEEVNSGLYYYAQPINQSNEVQAHLYITYKIDTLHRIYRQMWMALFLSLGIAYIGVLIVSFRMTKQISKPIEDIQRVAKELAKGNYEARTYEHRLDETGDLSRSINILASNLSKMTYEQQKQTNRLQTLIENMGSGLLLINERGNVRLVNRELKKILGGKANKWVNHNYKTAVPYETIVKVIEETFTFGQNVKRHIVLSLNIERKHFVIYSAPILNDEQHLQGVALLFHDITELKKLEKMRKDFVANVSHELKTPMTSIKGFAETLLDGAMDDDNVRKRFLEIILKESDRLTQLLQDLLDLSKLEKEEFMLHVSSFSLSEVIDECIIMLSGKAHTKQITLKANELDHPIIEADQARIKQVLLNLISNAITYTPQHGQIKITLLEKAEHVEINIKDTGIGMAKKEIPRIFERFYRVDKARSRQSGGTGLGLAIVKHIVEAHAGKIKVDSQEGVGTTFKIYLKKKLNK